MLTPVICGSCRSTAEVDITRTAACGNCGSDDLDFFEGSIDTEAAKGRYVVRHDKYGDSYHHQTVELAARELKNTFPPGEWYIWDRHEKKRVEPGQHTAAATPWGEIRTWADGYGIWHASVALDNPMDAQKPAIADAAREAIISELAARSGPNFNPEVVGVHFLGTINSGTEALYIETNAHDNDPLGRDGREASLHTAQWAVNFQSGRWQAIKSSRGTMSEAEAKAQAEKKNQAADKQRGRFKKGELGEPERSMCPRCGTAHYYPNAEYCPMCGYKGPNHEELQRKTYEAAYGQEQGQEGIAPSHPDTRRDEWDQTEPMQPFPEPTTFGSLHESTDRYVTGDEWGVGYLQPATPDSPYQRTRLNVHKTVPGRNRDGGEGIIVKHPEHDGKIFDTHDEARQYAIDHGLLHKFEGSLRSEADILADIRNSLTKNEDGFGYGVPAELVDKLDDETLKQLWMKIVHEKEIPASYFDMGTSRGDAVRNRARDIITNHLINQQMNRGGAKTHVDGRDFEYDNSRYHLLPSDGMLMCRSCSRVVHPGNAATHYEENHPNHGGPAVRHSSLSTTARHASPQAWRRLRGQMTMGELADIAKDIGGFAGLSPDQISKIADALIAHDWDSEKQASLDVSRWQPSLQRMAVEDDMLVTASDRCQFPGCTNTPRGGSTYCHVHDVWLQHLRDVNSKLHEITAGILVTNPGMESTAAVKLAAQTLERFPKLAGPPPPEMVEDMPHTLQRMVHEFQQQHHEPVVQ